MSSSSDSEQQGEVISSDMELRSYLLTDEELALAEAANPGVVRIKTAGRYAVRLRVGTHTLGFNLKKYPNGEKEFGIATSTMSGEMPSLLSSLVWHRAAEAILAVRQGHLEYRLERQKRKASKLFT